MIPTDGLHKAVLTWAASVLTVLWISAVPAHADVLIYAGTTLKTLITGSDFYPSDINDLGQIVGSDGAARYFYVYSGGMFQQISVEPFAHVAHLTGINDAGTIVGYGTVQGDGWQGFVLNNAGDITMLRVPTPGWNATDAFGINDQGVVVGSYDVGGSVHGFRYEDGLYTTLDFPGSQYTRLYDVNDSGQILGLYHDNIGTHYFISASGSFINLRLPCLSPGIVHFNDSAQIVGGCGDNAFVYDFDSGKTEMISSPQLWSYRATSINDNGEVLIAARYVSESSGLVDFGVYAITVLSLFGVAKWKSVSDIWPWVCRSALPARFDWFRLRSTVEFCGRLRSRSG